MIKGNKMTPTYLYRVGTECIYKFETDDIFIIVKVVAYIKTWFGIGCVCEILKNSQNLNLLDFETDQHEVFDHFLRPITIPREITSKLYLTDPERLEKIDRIKMKFKLPKIKQ
jgi:hypothetical protein